MFNTRQFNTTQLNSAGINAANVSAKSTVSVISSASVNLKSAVNLANSANTLIKSIVNVIVVGNANVYLDSLVTIIGTVNTPAKSIVNVINDASVPLKSMVNVELKVNVPIKSTVTVMGSANINLSSTVNVALSLTSTEENDFYKVMWDQKAKGEIIKHNNPLVAVDELQKQFTEELTDYVTSGVLSTALTSYLTDSALTTKLGQDYIVTGKIACNQLVAGTLDGFVITGSTITSVNTLTVGATGTSANPQIDFRVGLSANPASYNSCIWLGIFEYGTQANFEHDSLNIEVKSSENDVVSSDIRAKVVIKGKGYGQFCDLRVIGKLQAGFNANFSVDDNGYVTTDKIIGYSLSTKILLGNTGCYISTAGGDLRLYNSTGAYLMMNVDSLNYVKSTGVMTTLVF